MLTESDVISIHLLLNDETRGMISRACIEAMKPGVILVNTARGAIVDEEAMIDALQSGQIRHAGLDVFNIEPLPADHPLTKLDNVTLSAHSAFRTPEASENLMRAAWEHCRRIVKGSSDPLPSPGEAKLRAGTERPRSGRSTGWAARRSCNHRLRLLRTSSP